MKKIDNYIDLLYKHMDGKSEDVQTLKQEMKEHLLETVEGLKAEGCSEVESIETAISRFGEGRQIEDELSKVFKTEKKFAKVLLKVAIFLLVIFLTTLLPYVIIGTINSNKSVANNNEFNRNIDIKLMEGKCKPMMLYQKRI
ncbi:MAG TPA: permease prefix domain 1-containing protein [Clostridiaceae bacterium]